MLKKIEYWEKEINQHCEYLFKHPVFLGTVSTIFNLRAYRKNLVNNALTKAWKIAQLANRNDQEKLLSMVREMNYRLAELEQKLPANRAQTNDTVIPMVERAPTKKNRSQAETTEVVSHA